MILAKRVDRALGKPILGPEALDLAAAAAAEAVLGADPQAAVMRRGQREDAVFVDGGRVLAIEDHELCAIEAHQAAGGADPQKVVGGLGEGLHGLFG